MAKKILVLFLATVFFWGVSNSAYSAGDLTYPTTGLPENSGGIKAILENILNWMLGIIGVVAIMAFVVSGFQYFMAAGSEKTMETAKRNMIWSIIGIIAALSGYIIVKAVDAMLRGNTF